MEALLEQVMELIHAVTETVFYFRRQNYAKGYQHSKRAIKLGEEYFEQAVQVGFQDSVELLLPIWKLLLEATQAGDEVQLADLYEQQLLGALYEIQNCLLENSSGEPKSYWESNMALLEKKDGTLYQVLKNAKESHDREYAFSWAMTGDALLRVATDRGNVQLHSSVNPWQEALCFAGENVTAACSEYLVIGFGLGYHIETMSKMLSCRKLTVIEHDLEQLRIAFMYRDLSGILSEEKVTVVYCKEAADYGKWLSRIKDDMACVLWYPSIKTIAEDKLRESLENYWVSSQSIKNLGALLEDNFAKNIKKNDKNVDTLGTEFSGKTMVLVAAGPSLDNNIGQLKEIQAKEGVKIVCVGKAAKKLIGQGVRPDYLVMIDGLERTKWQIDGIEDTGIPLIYLSTVASTVVERYKGERYIAFQEDFDLAEEMAKEQGNCLYQTGGSVATFALDMGIRLGCSKIICVGLDLGYPGERSHAAGVDRKVVDTKSLRRVEGVDGKMISTSRTLDMYRKWIENRIQNVSGVTLMNASSGARIHGMQEKSIAESLAE
ncbi:MAG: 6-hydroxymethylpterin diphosphokinase MptE-like protein [Butyribacter sp.]|nr:DUF115 domain-containing protein [bacterium]MDY3853705.1 6-hydroxymethylpterin diphosphokinase MptE-like protein [Butyribacter sp.]